MTILLAAKDPELLGALRRARPDLRTLPLSPELPSGRIDGPLWCFVDWLLPEFSGLELVRQLRGLSLTRHGHITMILEEGDAEDQRRALRAGADDYLVGPLDPAKFAARIELYESGAATKPQPKARPVQGALVIDIMAHQLRYSGRPVALRPNEFRLLAHFMENPDRVFSRIALIDCLDKGEVGIDERTVDVWVGRLRRRLAANGVPNPLRTVRALGYVMDSVES